MVFWCICVFVLSCLSVRLVRCECFLIFWGIVMTGVGLYIIIIFLVSYVIVEKIWICLRRMVVSVILNDPEKCTTSIIRWMVSKTQRTFRWKILAFSASDWGMLIATTNAMGYVTAVMARMTVVIAIHTLWHLFFLF